ncbi:hypothetical protein LWI29_003203 [Acer saccharum]|uniref:Sphingomyelin synthase-like domain-containing protein n=1 Tax=Acer saccharum TaxID=4024 RepID=A0AA39TDB6_ACESA|nr:hypothetical protein LWI29_003203 [Acer saccharum]
MLQIRLSYCLLVSSVASRKHYTVDIVVAWYTVNLVVFFVDKKLPELPDRTSGNSPILLSLSMKDKDSWNKKENHKLLNGNSVFILLVQTISSYCAIARLEKKPLIFTGRILKQNVFEEESRALTFLQGYTQFYT